MALKRLKSMAAEALLVLFPMMLVQTNFLYPWGVTILTIETVLAVWLQLAQTKQQQSSEITQSRRLASLTCFRSSVMYFTFVAILAVDFPVFPRRFCKTEVMGYGLMDLGAGSFVVAAGLLPHKQVQQSWKRILPLFVLGLIRFAANRGLDYQEHMSEYGIHWNFFLTLAVVTPLASMCVSSLPILSSWIVPLVVMTCYQYALSNGLQEYMETAPRTCDAEVPLCDMMLPIEKASLDASDTFPLYLASCSIGRRCLWSNVDNARQRQKMLYGIARLLWLLQFMLASIIPVITAIHQPYLLRLDVGTQCTLVGTVGYGNHDHMTSPPIMMDAMNRHGLLVFVIANLLTGLVNLTFDTLHATDGTALLILSLYLGAVCGVALLLDIVSALMRKKKRSNICIQATLDRIDGIDSKPF